MWWIGRVVRVKKKYGKTWGKSRQVVSLINPPTAEGGQGAGPVVEVMCNWYKQVGTQPGKYTYGIVDHQWLGLESIICVVSMTVQPDSPGIFHLDPDHMKAVIDHVNSKEI